MAQAQPKVGEWYFCGPVGPVKVEELPSKPAHSIVTTTARGGRYWASAEQLGSRITQESFEFYCSELKRAYGSNRPDISELEKDFLAIKRPNARRRKQVIQKFHGAACKHLLQEFQDVLAKNDLPSITIIKKYSSADLSMLLIAYKLPPQLTRAAKIAAISAHVSEAAK